MTSPSAACFTMRTTDKDTVCFSPWQKAVYVYLVAGWNPPDGVR